MTPVNKLLDMIAAAIGADTVTFAPSLAAASFLCAVKTPFTPGPTTTFVNGTDNADFDGFANKAIAAGVRTAAVDPLVGGRKVILDPPAGGFRWTTTGTTNLPQTIYGVALTLTTNTLTTAKVLGCMLLETPVTLTATGQTFEVPEVSFNLIPGGIQ